VLLLPHRARAPLQRARPAGPDAFLLGFEHPAKCETEQLSTSPIPADLAAAANSPLTTPTEAEEPSRRKVDPFCKMTAAFHFGTADPNYPSERLRSPASTLESCF